MADWSEICEFATDGNLQLQRMSPLVDRTAAMRVRGQRQQHAVIVPSERSVGFLGLGAFGRPCAVALGNLGFDVAGWARREKVVDGITCFHGGHGFEELLKRSEILVSILPLTSETDGILNRQSISLLPEGASIVNVGRGEHVVEADLVTALDNGHLSAAALDVFSQEPLPADHP